MNLRQPLLAQYAPVVLFEHRSQYMRAQFVQTTHGGSSGSSDTQCPSTSSWGSFPASFDWRRCVNSAVENGQPSPSRALHYSSSPAASHPLRSTRWRFALKTIRGRSRRHDHRSVEPGKKSEPLEGSHGTVPFGLVTLCKICKIRQVVFTTFLNWLLKTALKRICTEARNLT